MTGPALRALAGARPACKITLMASPGGSQAATLLPCVDDVVVWRALWQDLSKDMKVIKMDGHVLDLLAAMTEMERPVPKKEPLE